MQDNLQGGTSWNIEHLLLAGSLALGVSRGHSGVPLQWAGKGTCDRRARPTQDMALPAPGMSEWTVKPWRKLLSCRCLNVVESSPKTGQRVEGGLLALAAGHHTQREQATKNAPSSACLPSGNGGRTDRGRKYGQDCCQAGWHSRLWPLLCCQWCRDHSYCGRHYQGPSTIHLQLLSDRNFGRTLQLGHCILPPASCFTFAT